MLVLEKLPEIAMLKSMGYGGRRDGVFLLEGSRSRRSASCSARPGLRADRVPRLAADPQKGLIEASTS
jgi:hypothetical protein